MRTFILVLLTLSISQPAFVGGSPASEFSESAPLACVGAACIGAGCGEAVKDLKLDRPAASSSYAASCSEGKCRSWQQWAVEGNYNSGSGTVEFSVRCGEESVVDCEASTSGLACRHGPEGPGGGAFECLHEILEGSPEEIFGACQDPLNPGYVFMAVPVGTPYDMDRLRVVRDSNGSLSPAQAQLP